MAKKLTKRREAFVKAAASGKPLSEAAREAGYSDSNGEVDRLVADPRVQAKLLRKIWPMIVTWKGLKEQAMAALRSNLDLTNLDPSPADRNSAARIVVEALAKIGAGSLADAAQKEDIAANRDEMVQEVLGRSAIEASEPEDAIEPDDQPVH